MKTVVQLRPGTTRDETPRCEILHGTPEATVSGELGPVALFSAGEVVAYQLRGGRRPRLFVFRTLDVDDRLAASIPGIRPRVRLLLELRSTGRIRRARGLFAYLVRTSRDPSSLPDAFYFRVSAALGGKLPPHKILFSLLSPPPAPNDAWTF